MEFWLFLFFFFFLFLDFLLHHLLQAIITWYHFTFHCWSYMLLTTFMERERMKKSQLHGNSHFTYSSECEYSVYLCIVMLLFRAAAVSKILSNNFTKVGEADRVSIVKESQYVFRLSATG